MTQKALILGASKNIGRGIVEQLAKRGWEVTGTVRQPSGTQLHDLAGAHPEYQILIEQLDTTKDIYINSLHEKLLGQKFDLLLCNAGIARGEAIKEMTPETFTTLMLTNVFAPLRCIENFDDLLTEKGMIAVTSSGVGSLSLNANSSHGGFGTYRASKSALNQLMISYGHDHPERPIVLIDPGWVRTDLDSSNANARLSVEQSTTGIVNMLEKHLSEAGVQFRSYDDQIIPW